MKKLNYLVGLIAIISLVFTSCEDRTSDDITINVYNDDGGATQGTTLSGTKTTDLTLNADIEYVLDGPLVMSSGTTLTIPAGTTINALPTGSNVYIAIAQGARILANGTAENPIIMTSSASAPEAGDWGGLIILGKAPINSVSGEATSTSEIASLPYGGTLPNDDSGVLKYVRISYSGGAADGQSENNGLSLYGVGNGTTVEYIHIEEGKDDGIEFFGGTVNVSYISVIGAQDDSIDWTEGYTGTITDAYVQHGISHDKGIEADGYNTDIGNNSSPQFWSKPTVNNLYIKGQGSATSNEAIRLRAGTQGLFDNVVIEWFEEGFDLDGDTGNNPTGSGVISNDLQVSNVNFIDVTLNHKNDTGVSFSEADFLLSIGTATASDYTIWGAWAGL